MPQNNDTPPPPFKPRRSLPENISPAAAEAVLEDALLEAAADLAALSATLGVAPPPGSDALGLAPLPESTSLDNALPIPETPEEEELMDILGVPHLGPVRRGLLADAGIDTLADLEALPEAGLAAVKGVGIGNARRIKLWLAARPAAPLETTLMPKDTSPPAAPAPAAVPSSPAPTPRETPVPAQEAAPQAPAPAKPGSAELRTPPPPLPPDAPPAPAAVGDSVDRSLAIANEQVQELFRRVDEAAVRLKVLFAPGPDMERLERQLTKLDTAASELAEGPDVMPAKQLQRAVKSLGKAVAVLEDAAAEKRLSPKKQDALLDALKEHRKALEKTLGE